MALNPDITSPAMAVASPSVVVLPSVEGLASLADDALIEVQRQAGAARRRVDAVNAAIAGEIARRSDRALGHQGLAARLGAATPEAAIQSLTGVSVTDARALTAVGVAIDTGSPWLAPVTSAVADGTLSVASAAAITRGLGAPTATVAADDLLDAATELVDLARESTPESAARSARVLREGLDIASVADLEAHRRSRRSLKWFEQPDGMTRMIGILDPESAAIITGAIDAVLSPRRGGPRFVDPVDVERAAAMVADPRTNEQYAVDTLVEIVNLATRAATSTLDQASLFTDRTAPVRVHIQADTLHPGAAGGTGTGTGRTGSAGTSTTGTGTGTDTDTDKATADDPALTSAAAAPTTAAPIDTTRIGTAGAGSGAGIGTGAYSGAAYIEGQTGLISTETAERYICTSGTLPVIFSGTTAIDAGHTHRLHSPRQRIAIAAQWNGCAWPDCPKPAIMTEIHHIDAFNGSNTTLANAIPLCRFHHMELHANHWTITRTPDDGTYWLKPPDPQAESRRLRSRSPVAAIESEPRTRRSAP